MAKRKVKGPVLLRPTPDMARVAQQRNAQSNAAAPRLTLEGARVKIRRAEDAKLRDPRSWEA